MYIAFHRTAACTTTWPAAQVPSRPRRRPAGRLARPPFDVLQGLNHLNSRMLELELRPQLESEDISLTLYPDVNLRGLGLSFVPYAVPHT